MQILKNFSIYICTFYFLYKCIKNYLSFIYKSVNHFIYRISVHLYLFILLGDTHVYRNAGGRVTEDAIRSAIISHKFLASNLILVIHHTGCGMEGLTNEAAASLFEHDLETCKKTSEGYKPAGMGPFSHYLIVYFRIL